MKRLWPLLLLPLLTCWGCSICCSPYDDHFPAYGGKWERDTPNIHRLGSAFENAGHRVDAKAADAHASVGEDADEDLAPQPPQVPTEEHGWSP